MQGQCAELVGLILAIVNSNSVDGVHRAERHISPLAKHSKQSSHALHSQEQELDKNLICVDLKCSAIAQWPSTI